MAGTGGPDGNGGAGRDKSGDGPVVEGSFDERRERLGKALSGKRKSNRPETVDARSGAGAGYAFALRLSSEFIAGILVGAGIGWLIDRFAGTSPWGLIVFFLLGFCAGVLNVMRSAGMVAERGANRTNGK